MHLETKNKFLAMYVHITSGDEFTGVIPVTFSPTKFYPLILAQETK